MLLLRWLLWLVGFLLQASEGLSEQQKSLFKAYKHSVSHCLSAFDLMYSHGLWLQRKCAVVLYSHLMLLLRGYKRCARLVLDMKHTGFGLKPKYHGTHHLAHSIRKDLQAGCDLIINPMHAGNEQNEDKVGKVSRVSKKISTRTVTNTILQRYFLKKKALLRRSHFKKRPEKASGKK